MMKNIKVRFAPSPTGHLHIGGIRTALWNFAYTQKLKGEFMVRIEDTDQNRFVPGSEAEIFEMISAYGLSWDSKARQSDRIKIYQEYAEKLVELGAAYYCFLTENEIAEQKKIAAENKIPYKFGSQYRDLPLAEAKKKVAAGDKFVIRQKIPVGREIVFVDQIQGKATFNSDEINDGVLLKSDGFPTYHLAVVVDDHLMGITHALRGTEWLPSAPKHVLLYEALGWDLPEFFHFPLILDPDGGKLSKRKGSVSAIEFLKEGYLPEAILNFLMLLGWSPKVEREYGEKEREIFSLADFIELFDPHDLNKTAAVFNREKLLWFNQKYIQMLEPDMLVIRFSIWLKKYSENESLIAAIIDRGPDYLEKVLELVKSRVRILSEIPQMISFYYQFPALVNLSAIKQLKNIDPKILKTVIKKFLVELEKYPDFAKWQHEDWESYVRKLAEYNQLKAGQLFMALRVMITGTPFSPPLWETMETLGQQEIFKRINAYL
ncbi:MAG: glutamate--tRNA ligase [bacterium]